MKKIFAFSVSIAFFLLFVSSSFALEIFGPPSAGLNEAQWGSGFDYSHSRTDLKLRHGNTTDSNYYSTTTSKIASWKIRDFTTDVVTANISLGLTNQVEGFARLGITASRDSESSLVEYPVKYAGDQIYSYGFGVKATFWEQDDLKLGGICQYSVTKIDSTATIDKGGPYGPWHYSLNMPIQTIQIAVGPTYKLDDTTSVYGGTFFQLIRGDIKLLGADPNGTAGPYVRIHERYSAEIRQESLLGGFIGIQMELSKDNPLCIEYQRTATDDLVAASIRWKF